MAKKKGEKLYTDTMIGSLYGLTKGMAREVFPVPDRIVFDSRGYGHPAWYQSTVEKALQDPLVQGYISERKPSGRLDDITAYLKRFDYSEMVAYARTMDRKFVLHIGPTNSGKTYQALQELKKAEKGTYLCPLRLLALEVFDQLNMDGVPCSLLTGEERLDVPFSGITASTIEMADYDEQYDVAVIDEAQMISDSYRGDKWFRAIYCLNAKVIHVCLALEAASKIQSMLKGIGAKFSVIYHHRMAPLEFAGTLSSLEQVEAGDALIVFSRKSALAVAAELERKNIRASLVYGALPPASRREEVRRFVTGETKVVVATDAIGMGLSLPIRRIIFCETEKFDGFKTRLLLNEEIRQISGRAGRFGIYDKGYVLTMENTELIRNALTEAPHQRRTITIPFPEEALETSWPIDVLLSAWSKIPLQKGITRTDMTDALFLYSLIKPYRTRFDRKTLYQLIRCPFDVGKMKLVNFWKDCVRCAAFQLPLPEPEAGEDSLEECETRYRQMDILHHIASAMHMEDNRIDEKMQLSERINRLIAEDIVKYERRCAICESVIPAVQKSKFCKTCRKSLHGHGLADEVRLVAAV